MELNVLLSAPCLVKVNWCDCQTFNSWKTNITFCNKVFLNECLDLIGQNSSSTKINELFVYLTIKITKRPPGFKISLLVATSWDDKPMLKWSLNGKNIAQNYAEFICLCEIFVKLLSRGPRVIHCRRAPPEWAHWAILASPLISPNSQERLLASTAREDLSNVK